MRAPGVSTALTAALVLQVAIGAALVVGDLGSAGLSVPRLGPSAPALTQPILPGDQRRRFDPDAPRPSTGPARDGPPLPSRLTLTRETDEIWRLAGEITVGDGERLSEELARMERLPERLRLDSPGGSVADALALGRYLRSEGIATEVGAGAICFSSCPYLFAGGLDRSAEGQLGVHQHYFGQSTILPAFMAVEEIQRGQSEVMGYLIEMGIDPEVMRHALATPPSELYMLLPDELERYGFVAAPE
ncbi:COG3904 family protein [Litorisediminicola beolgyonensis]|uniref:Periplasmic protein-like protein n=1 Tax=Litorisediminicola beolgyonensis TaxID=1173614 RepID=A0ABW3ZCT5_9RHOB